MLSTSTVDTYLWTSTDPVVPVVVGLSAGPAYVCSMVMVITCHAIVYRMGTPFSSVNTHHIPYTDCGLPVPKFLEVKPFLGPKDGPVDGPGWGGASEVDFLLFMPLLDVILVS